MPYINGVQFTFGADPEGFLFDKKKERYVTAHDKIPGTKEMPAHIPGFHIGTMQVDGMAVEFNVPSTGFLEDFVNFTHDCKDYISRYLGRRRYRLDFLPTCEFEEEEWLSAPDEAKILGCDPDFNGWTGRMNPAPDPADKMFRTGAGHIHIGWGNGFELDDDMSKVAGAVAREMDASVGVASVLFDGDKKRRKLYGKAGAFRPKHYGMEYRTLSNAWVKSVGLTDYVIRMTHGALVRLMERRPIHSKEVKEIINRNKTDDAKHWMNEHSLPLPDREFRVD